MTEESLFELLSLECRTGRNGTVYYHNVQGYLHRVHGPAVKYADGTHAWYQNGQMHRLDGPAIEYPDGDRSWYINGIVLTEAAWQQAVASVETV